MKYCLFLVILWSNTLKSQDWRAEFMLGAAAYNGDLTQNALSAKRFGPAVAFNIKYVSNSFWAVRAGLAYGKISGDDRQNRDLGLQSRNLNFQSHVFEFSLCGELAVVDPELYYSYPYIFGGVGLFKFNPYTFDDNNQKTFLQPLGTEGQGLADFPNRKKYSLYQFCIPIGAGWKMNIKDRFEISYEFGYRILFTDYLDDVSKTYVSLDQLSTGNGPKAAELSYRRKGIPFMEEGEVRGNPKVKDIYFFNGFKIATRIGKKRLEHRYDY